MNCTHSFTVELEANNTEKLQNTLDEVIEILTALKSDINHRKFQGNGYNVNNNRYYHWNFKQEDGYNYNKIGQTNEK